MVFSSWVAAVAELLDNALDEVMTEMLQPFATCSHPLFCRIDKSIQFLINKFCLWFALSVWWEHSSFGMLMIDQIVLDCCPLDPLYEGCATHSLTHLLTSLGMGVLQERFGWKKKIF
jgi:hypothetical protein